MLGFRKVRQAGTAPWHSAGPLWLRSVSAGCRTLDRQCGSASGGRKQHLREVAERHIRMTVKLLSSYTVLENTEGSGDLPLAVFILVVNLWIFILFKFDLKKILKFRIYFYKMFNFRFIVDSFHQKPLKSRG
jgi:hypothetical protein